MTISDSEVIIGVFEFVGDTLDGFGDLLQNDFFTGTGLVAVVGILGTILGQKLQEQHIARETARINHENAIKDGKLKLENLEKLRDAELDAKKKELKANGEVLKSEIDKTAQEKQQLIYQKAQARLKENPSADLSDLMAESQQVAQEAAVAKNAVDQQTEQSIQNLTSSYDSQIKLQKEINFNLEKQGTLIGSAGNA